MAFTDFGLDSAKSLILVGKLESIVDQNLDPTILWNYPTINKLAKFIHSQLSGIQNATENHEDERNDDFTKKVEELSEEEAAELLLKKLNENK